MFYKMKHTSRLLTKYLKPVGMFVRFTFILSLGIEQSNILNDKFHKGVTESGERNLWNQYMRVPWHLGPMNANIVINKLASACVSVRV